MKDQFASYFEKPEFKETFARYEEMLQSGDTRYFEATELTEIAEYYAMYGDSKRAEEALDYDRIFISTDDNNKFFNSTINCFFNYILNCRSINDR